MMKELSSELRQHMDGIDNVVFDVGNVLIRFDTECILKTLFPAEYRDVLRHALYVHDHKWWWGSFDEGCLPDEQVAKKIAQEAGVPQSAEHILYALYHFHEDRNPLPLAQDIPVLKEMGKKVYALTNYNDTAFGFLKKKMPFFSLMDGIVVSAEEKCCKPDRRIYELLLNRYGLEANRTLFIDDSPLNVQGARDAGIRGWHYLPEDMREKN